MGSDIIKISHLNKSFGEVKAVNDLSFRVKKGELFAFLGVNGKPLQNKSTVQPTGNTQPETVQLLDDEDLPF